MEQRSRFADTTEVYETIVDAVQAKIRTAMPVSPSKDSPDGHTIELQPSVKAVQINADGMPELVQMTVLPDIPILHAGGGDIYTTHAHKSGDEGVIINVDASPDDWHAQGGVQPPGDASMHPLSGGFYLPGAHSTPRKLKGVSSNSSQTRTTDKKSVHDVSHTAISTVREDAAHQVNGKAVQTQKGGASHVVDAKTIQQVAGKILMNC